MNADVLSPLHTASAELPCNQSWRAQLMLEFSASEQRSFLSKRWHQGPIRVQKALWPEVDPRICHVIVVHPPAGVAGGDQIDINIHCQSHSHAVLTTPGAGKLYKSDGRVAKMHTQLKVEADAFLEWLPQEIMLYDQAIAETELNIQLDPQSSFIGWDMLVVGRQARQECFNTGRFSSRVRITVGQQLQLFDQLRIQGNDLWLRSALGLNGHAVSGTFWALPPLQHRGAAQMDEHIAQLRELLMRMDLPVVITRLDQLMVARYVGPSNQDCLEVFAALRAKLRLIWLGLVEYYPRIWRT